MCLFRPSFGLLPSLRARDRVADGEMRNERYLKDNIKIWRPLGPVVVQISVGFECSEGRRSSEEYIITWLQ